MSYGSGSPGAERVERKIGAKDPVGQMYRGMSQEAALGARDLYRSDEPLPSQFVDWDPRYREMLGSLEDLARSGSPVTQAFLDEWGATVGGEYLGPNPYMDEYVERAAGIASRPIDSGMARAGRYGSPGAEQARADIRSATAARLYGPEYRAGRREMMEALGMLPMAQAAETYDDILLGSVGREYMAREDALNAEALRQYQHPYWKQAMYEASLSGNPLAGEGQTKTQAGNWGAVGAQLGIQAAVSLLDQLGAAGARQRRTPAGASAGLPASTLDPYSAPQSGPLVDYGTPYSPGSTGYGSQPDYGAIYDTIRGSSTTAYG